jgi:pimeloyl-ACP methyl ester carboxylesterase
MALPSAAALAVAPLLVRGVGEAVMMASATRTSSEQAVYRTLKMVSPDYSRIPAEVIQAHLEAHRPRHGDADANTAFLQTGRSLLIANLRRASFYARVRRVRAPALVVQGSEDRLVPMAAIRKLLAVRPDWDLHVFEGLGHVPMMEDPAGFNQVVLGWIAGRDRAAA